MLKITNPATGETLAELKTDSEQTVAEAFARAKLAQSSWQETAFTERAQIFKCFIGMLAERKEEFAKTLTQEMGKPITQAENEIAGTIGRLEYFVSNAEQCLASKQIREDETQGLSERISFEPLGVIGNISAWNYPYFVGLNVIAPALLTGNAVLYKPSEYATLSGLNIVKLLHEAGVPLEILQPLVGGGEVGALLARCPLDGMFFTGSVRTGKAIAEASAKNLVKLQLELGGKDPIYVCEDVEVAASAASIADGAFYNTGQSCCAVERVYVRQEIAAEFVKEFVKAVKSFSVGDPLNRKTYIGPLAREAQLAVLENQVQDAIKKGAVVLWGVKRSDRGKNYFEPTVLGNADHTMDLMREESFGPIIGIQIVSSDEEAVTLMNDTDYGLTAGVFTKKTKRGEKILSKINSGTAYINCSDRVVPALPWSGRKCSGLGVTLSTQGIETFLRPKAWHIKK